MIMLSFVIPTKNEEKFICRCLNSIFNQPIRKKSYEVIVVDNGSTDNTMKILKNYKKEIKILENKIFNISGLRNYGARVANGEWLAFIDADVELDPKWYENFLYVLERAKNDGIDLNKLLTGATYSIPNKCTWVERIWYEQLVSRDKARVKYINSGNLVINRNIFEKVGGFNINYKTGEDTKICEDAIRVGGIMVKNIEMEAIHHGYPKTLIEFFKRERWHGLGMKAYLSRPWKSRDLSLSLFYMFSAYFALTVFLLSKEVFSSILILFFAIIIPVLPLAIKRSYKKFDILLPLLLLYIIYGIARAISLGDIFLQFCKEKIWIIKLR